MPLNGGSSLATTEPEQQQACPVRCVSDPKAVLSFLLRPPKTYEYPVRTLHLLCPSAVSPPQLHPYPPRRQRFARRSVVLWTMATV